MASGIHFSMPGGTVLEMEKKLKRAALAVVKYWDGPIEAHMKHNAPWTDRTSNARNGLSAVGRKIGKLFAIILSHSVDYGIYLERGTERMKARPIIRPTIGTFAPKVISTLQKILDRL